ncbi:MAG: SpoIID/LytB domain-containing protein [Bacteroidales bacterium]
MKIFGTLLIVFCVYFTYAQNINIQIHYNKRFDEFSMTTHNGSYDIISGNNLIYRVEKGETVDFSVRWNRIKISYNNKSTLTNKTVTFRGVQQSCYFTLSHPQEVFPEREYDNDLYISLRNNVFSLINDVNFEKYIAGVVEAEGGAKEHVEYYKAQSILCRTYAAKHYTKHLDEGFNLCDGQHCQAYKGRCKYNLSILDAALQTAGLVVVDSQRNLISATFYANSGGLTANSEDVWISALPYLRAVEDTFSLGGRGAVWEKSIPVDRWKDYLHTKGFSVEPCEEFVPYDCDTVWAADSLLYADSVDSTQYDYDTLRSDSLSDSLQVQDSSTNHVLYRIDTVWNHKQQKHYPLDFTFKQPVRKKYFSFRGCDTLVTLRSIRSDWRLRSTFFSVSQVEDSVILHGKGYGHGVGLSQEGAMRMAQLGYSYDEIITYYFTDVQIMNIRAVNFYRVDYELEEEE